MRGLSCGNLPFVNNCYLITMCYLCLWLVIMCRMSYVVGFKTLSLPEAH